MGQENRNQYSGETTFRKYSYHLSMTVESTEVETSILMLKIHACYQKSVLWTSN